MKKVTIRDPKGKWTWAVNVASSKERALALRKLGVDPRKSKVARMSASVPVRLG